MGLRGLKVVHFFEKGYPMFDFFIPLIHTKGKITGGTRFSQYDT